LRVVAVNVAVLVAGALIWFLTFAAVLDEFASRRRGSGSVRLRVITRFLVRRGSGDRRRPLIALLLGETSMLLITLGHAHRSSGHALVDGLSGVLLLTAAIVLVTDLAGLVRSPSQRGER
jgi:hypothetical protein